MREAEIEGVSRGAEAIRLPAPAAASVKWSRHILDQVPMPMKCARIVIRGLIKA